MSDFELMGSLKDINGYKLIRGTKHGDKFMSWIQKLSASQCRIFAGLLGIVGMAGLYFTLQDGEMSYFESSTASDARGSSHHTVAGLKNLGNNCFLNVILQALASTSCFLPFLQNMLPGGEKFLDVNAKQMPLLVALKTLLEELSIVPCERAVLNPEKVMLVLDSYVDNFKLTRPQDAAEALLHLLSSLEQELQGRYLSKGSSLAVITESASRIHMSRVEGQRECERRRTQILEPFYGAIGSILTCESCSSVISTDVYCFHCLPLSAVLDRSTHIMDGCTLVNCLEKFTTVEHLENYRCAQCWHIAALKYLSHMQGDNKAKINRLKHCVRVNLNSCDCRQLFHEEEISLTVNSHAKKQLIITCCPKILCIQLQRAYMNDYGEFMKLEGHISFPSYLDLSPFVKSGTAFEREALVENMQDYRKDGQQPIANCVDELEKQMLEDSAVEHVCTGNITRNELQESVNQFSNVSYEINAKSNNDDAVLKNETVFSDLNVSEACSQDDLMLDRKSNGTAASCSSVSYGYRLASVVEHYSKSGSGHYAAYRRVASEPNCESFIGASGRLIGSWVYVSDHEVSNVSEDGVFAAEASLLFFLPKWLLS